MDLAAARAFVKEYVEHVPCLKEFVDADRMTADRRNLNLPVHMRSADQLYRYREEFIDLVTAVKSKFGPHVNVPFTFDEEPAPWRIPDEQGS